MHGLAQFMIDQARNLGYQLVTFGECMGDERRFWYRDPVTGMPWNSSEPVGLLQPGPGAPSSTDTSSTSTVTSTSSTAAPTGTPSPTVNITPQPSVTPIPGVNALGSEAAKGAVLGAGLLAAITGTLWAWLML